MVESSTNTVD